MSFGWMSDSRRLCLPPIPFLATLLNDRAASGNSEKL